VSSGAELDAAAIGPGQLGEPQAGLHGEGDEGTVTSTFPPGQVRSGEEGIDFVGLEEGLGGLVEALLRSRKVFR
jgi:hypothetical protein